MNKTRYLALDAMRGLTLAMMILVNNPGSWSDVYPALRHADWNGATMTDMVFPFFLFIVGSAMVFSQKTLLQLSPTQRFGKIITRTVILFAMGVFLNAYPFQTDWEQLRIMGVLQRIALAYCLAAFIIHLSFWGRIVSAVMLVLIYSALYPIFSADYSLNHNLVRQIDLSLLGASHLWQGKGVAFDPEGLLSTLPATVNLLLGFEFTRILIQTPSALKAKITILLSAIVLMIGAFLLDNFIPINKSLWTVSFVLLSSGSAAILLLLIVEMEKIRGTGLTIKAFAIYGQNPLFIYVLSWLWVASYPLASFSGANLHTHIYSLFLKFLNPLNASLGFAIFHVGLFWLVAYLLHRKKIIVSI
jgi:predicted acyltransferase